MEEQKEGFEVNYKLTYHSERQKRIWDSLVYGHQRIDILVIALASAGIYVCFETLKYQIEKNILVSPVIKVSAFLLLLSIIANLLSQIFSTKVHFNDYEICEYCISLEKDDIEKCMDEIKKRETTIDKFEKYGKWSTNASYGLLLSGLSFLLVFFLFIF